MTTEILQNGSEIANEFRCSSEDCTSPQVVPTTLVELLAKWDANPPREATMLRTTCARLADYHEAQVHEITIDAVAREQKGFRPFLESRKYAENSIRTYVNHVRILLCYATEAGWRPASLSPSPEWLRVVQLATEKKCADLARHLQATRSDPREVTPDDVDQWVLTAAQATEYQSASIKRIRFWRILRDCGYATKLPKCLLREKHYGIPIRNFPEGLKKEVTDLLQWKQAFYVWDRECGPHRPPTARRLAHVISALYGFAVNIAGEPGISSLSDLAQRQIVGPFIQWSIAEREVKGQTLQRNLRMLDSAMHQHPRYAALDLKWFKKLLGNIPVESDTVLNKRRAEKVLDYAVVEQIPEKIRAQRPTFAKNGPKQLAFLIRDELLIRWLTILPWRQRNLRECRIGGPNPNLFKGTVSPITTIDMQPWAIEERRKNPNAEFWQFHFTEEETKTGCAVDALLPIQLIEPLEEYLSTYRAHLLREHDPFTLFLNRAGKPMSLNLVTQTVSKYTLRLGGRRVTPHHFRDIVAFAWLKSHPKDYLSVSKMLWHANPNEVIKTYGSLFNESSGVCSMEAWLLERETKRAN